MAFGYFPDYKDKNKLKDWYLRIFGYPYAPRRNEARLVFKLLDPKPGEKILDIGCGNDIWTNELAKTGAVLTGLDYSEHDVNKARERAEKLGISVQYKLGNAENMPFEDGSFDKAFSVSTFEHIKDDLKALEECSRVIKGGGDFVLSVPTPKYPSIINLFIKFPRAIKSKIFKETIKKASSGDQFRKLLDDKYKHHRNYTLDDLEQKLLAAGFESLEIKYNIGFFGRLPHALLHSLKVFGWDKMKDTSYSFRNTVVFALVFPLLNPFYRLDDFLMKDGYTLILRVRKIA